MPAATHSSRIIYALAHAGDTAAVRTTLLAAQRAASQCGGTVQALLFGPADSQAQSLDGPELGLNTVWHVGMPADAQTHQIVAALSVLLRDGSIPCCADTLFIAQPDTLAAEAVMRLAARLDGTAVGRCDELEQDDAGHLLAHRPAFGGRLQVALRCTRGPYFVAMRGPVPASVALASTSGQDAAPSAAQPDAADDAKQPKGIAAAPPAIHHVESTSPLPASYAITRTASGERAVSLEGARLVVAGGRGMGGEEGFAALHALAAALDGAVGGSLPAVDAGWAPVSRQIGQSGKYVSPDIYLAVGISGTPQHLAGIDAHARIVAINKDPDAWIFGRAKVGVVADWREFLPVLMEAVMAER